ncbi:UNVERIFIED_ORG: N-acetylglucosaminyldiphosphoundecaprenol N-acetyl-beta-D-mannosaminyltransferase [Arthrobacter sp. UYEF2]
MHLIAQLPVSRRRFAGISFSVANLAQATKLIITAAVETRTGGLDIHLLNAYSLALAERSDTFRACLVEASDNFPDGKPLSWLTKLSKAPLKQVRGPSLFERVLDEGREQGVRHLLLGSTPETLALLEASLVSRYPGLHIVGSISPPFRNLSADDYETQDDEIASCRPHIVWVGLGTPKQDFEAQRLARQGDFLAIAVGAAFDFSAGTKKEAPPWMAHIGVEWIYRFGSEPKRLWRRYLVGNFVFLYSAVRRRG